ncbi:MAG: hypothetical protein NC121_15415 [Blautia sp.]|nr:hypothetical protein [Blautia sp.]
MSGNPGNAEGIRADRRIETAWETARNLYDLGIEVDKIAQGVGYTVETVKQWLGLSDDIQSNREFIGMGECKDEVHLEKKDRGVPV